MAISRRPVMLVLVVVLASLPVIWPLFKPGWFLTQDADTLIIRLAEFHRMLRDGQFPVRYGTIINFGWGYPVFTFLYPLPLLAMEMVHLTGFGFIASAKFWLIIATIASSLSMFLWIRSWFDAGSGLAAALLYIYAPYRISDLYVRGSIGEVTAFVFPPLVCWSLQRFSITGKLRFIAAGSLSWMLLILSHNSSAFLFSILLFGWLIWVGKNSHKWKFLLVVPVLAVLLSAWFWLPVVVERNFVQFNPVAVFSENYVYPQQLFWSLNLPLSWGFEGSGPGPEDGMSFQVGVVSWLVILAALFLKERIAKILLTVIALSIFAMLPWSDALWRISKIEGFFQFPWRLLAIPVFTAAILVGLLLKGRNRWSVIAVCSAIILVVFPYIRVNKILPEDDAFYATNDGTTTIGNEYMPKVVKEKLPPRQYNEIVIRQGQGKFVIRRQKSNDILFTTNSPDNLIMRVNTINYPGWQVSVDKISTAISIEPRWGLIEFNVPKGEHTIRVWFGETWWRIVADIVSLGSFLFLLGGGFKWQKAW